MILLRLLKYHFSYWTEKRQKGVERVGAGDLSQSRLSVKVAALELMGEARARDKISESAACWLLLKS